MDKIGFSLKWSHTSRMWPYKIIPKTSQFSSKSSTNSRVCIFNMLSPVLQAGWRVRFLIHGLRKLANLADSLTRAIQLL